MPIKYRIKDYKANSYYHIYNKGIDGRKVFEDEADYLHFEKLLKQYTTPFTVGEKGPYKSLKPSTVTRMQEMNLHNEAKVVAYCLMPDHFHLLIHQTTEDGITKLMRRINTGYVMVFNKKHSRSGPLFETNYRAVLIQDTEQLLHMTRFIHLNPVSRIVRRFGPVETVTGTSPGDYEYSSYTHYIGLKRLNWVQTLPIGIEVNEYRRLCEDPRINSEKILVGLTIDGTE